MLTHVPISLERRRDRPLTSIADSIHRVSLATRLVAPCSLAPCRSGNLPRSPFYAQRTLELPTALPTNPNVTIERKMEAQARNTMRMLCHPITRRPLVCASVMTATRTPNKGLGVVGRGGGGWWVARVRSERAARGEMCSGTVAV